MVKRKIPKKVKEEINEYVDVLKKDKLPIKKVILFGSYAKGGQHEWSDIDVCIVSPKFKDPWKAMQYLSLKREIRDIHYTIEPHGYSTKDFREGSSLINEIKRTGIEIPV